MIIYPPLATFKNPISLHRSNLINLHPLLSLITTMPLPNTFINIDAEITKFVCGKLILYYKQHYL